MSTWLHDTRVAIVSSVALEGWRKRTLANVARMFAAAPGKVRRTHATFWIVLSQRSFRLRSISYPTLCLESCCPVRSKLKRGGEISKFVHSDSPRDAGAAEGRPPF